MIHVYSLHLCCNFLCVQVISADITHPTLPPSRQVALSFPQALWKNKMTLSPPTKVASVSHVSGQITITHEPQ